MKKIFTLVELLIVIAIISILSALLLPALNKARSKAYSTHCTNNYRQIHISAMGYADTYQYMPCRIKGAGAFSQMYKAGFLHIVPNGLISCPLYPEEEYRVSSSSANNYQYPQYLWNSHLGHTKNDGVDILYSHVTLSSIRRPSYCLVMGDAPKVWMDSASKVVATVEIRSYSFNEAYLERFHSSPRRKSLSTAGSVQELSVIEFEYGNSAKSGYRWNSANPTK